MTPPLWLANLAAYSLQVAALVGATAFLVAVVRVPAPRVRLALWQALLIGCLALPFLQPWRPTPVFHAPVAEEVAMSALALTTAPESFEFPLVPMVAGVLVTGAFLRLAWLGLGLLRLARYRRNMIALDPLPQPFVEAAACVGAKATVGVAAGLRGPATFGLRRPLVLLPPAVLTLEPALQQSVVCHELLHVRRRDWIWSVGEEILSAVAWFHPAIWWLLAQIDLAREQHVDAEVVRLTGGRKPYLEALLYLAGPERGADLAPASALLRRRHLVKRLRVLAQEVSMSRSRIVGVVVVVAVLAALTAGAAAVSFPLAAPPVDEAVVAARQAQAPVRIGGDILPPKKIVDVRPVYPPDAREAGVQGVVILEVVIRHDGTVEDAKVVRSVPMLDQAALDAVRQWVFTPTLLNGTPVPVIMTVTVNFVLDSAKSAGVAAGVEGGVPGGVAGGVPGGQKGPHRDTPPLPKRTYFVSPAYPEAAREQKVEGVVILEVLIGTNGVAADVKAIKGDDLLSGAAIDAVRKWRWEPPAKPTVATVTVRFALDEHAEQAAYSNVTDTKLEVVREVKPEFPRQAQDAKLAGSVEVEVLVDANGRVSSARVLKGADAFHEVVLDAARQWEFKPPGKPVKTTLEFTFAVK